METTTAVDDEGEEDDDDGGCCCCCCWCSGGGGGDEGVEDIDCSGKGHGLPVVVTLIGGESFPDDDDDVDSRELCP